MVVIPVVFLNSLAPRNQLGITCAAKLSEARTQSVGCVDGDRNDHDSVCPMYNGNWQLVFFDNLPLLWCDHHRHCIWYLGTVMLCGCICWSHLSFTVCWRSLLWPQTTLKALGLAMFTGKQNQPSLTWIIFENGSQLAFHQIEKALLVR